jgi:DNA-binding IclR family transcriptional regulator
MDVLRALLRLARRRSSPSLDQLVLRVGADESGVRRALFTLAKNGLVQRTPAGLRLSLAGLAVAVAYAQSRPARRTLVATTSAGSQDRRDESHRAA